MITILWITLAVLGALYLACYGKAFSELWQDVTFTLKDRALIPIIAIFYGGWIFGLLMFIAILIVADWFNGFGRSLRDITHMGSWPPAS